jgi:hypothetical protein
MSWLERALKASRSGPVDGPVYGYGDLPMDRARPKLLDLLRERDAQRAVIAYDGGHDEGWITEFFYSSEPGDEEPDPATSTVVDPDAAFEDFESPDGRLLAAADAVVSDKWGTFAGEFEVKGRLLVDVPSGRIVRRDSLSVEDGPFEPEVEEF